MKSPRLIHKVLLGQVAMFAVIGVVESFVSGYTLDRSLTREFESKGTAIAAGLASASEDLVVTRDASRIQSLIDQYRQIRGVGYVMVVDGGGTILGHTFAPEVPKAIVSLAQLHHGEPHKVARTRDVTLEDGGEYFDLAAPIRAGAGGQVHVGMDRRVIRTGIRAAILTQILAVVGLFAGAVAVAVIIVRRDAARLEHLTTYASTLAAQDFEAGFSPVVGLEGLAAGPADEIGNVARSFVAMEHAIGGYLGRLRKLAAELATYNETLEATVARRTEELQEKNRAVEAALEGLKQAQEQILRQEKLASLGSLTAGIAHEIKNPLNFVINFSELAFDLLTELKEDLAKNEAVLDPGMRANLAEVIEQLEMNLSKIKEHGGRADGIVRSMLLHSRGTTGQRQATDVNTLVRDAVGLAYHGMRGQDLTFQVAIANDFDPAVGRIDAVPQDLMRAFLNIANNACYAASHRSPSRPDAGPAIRVSTRRLGESVEIRIRDNGDGIPAHVRDKVFEPFFTTKPAGQGTGLGLSICYDIIVGQHKGTMTIDTEPGSFTEFVIGLPGALATAGIP